MSALEASIENLTAEHTVLTQKLEQIDQQYRWSGPWSSARSPARTRPFQP